MCNKIKQIYKGFSTCGFDSFFFFFLEERVILEQPFTHVGFHTRTFLVAGWIRLWASEVSERGDRVTLPQMIPFGGPQMGPKSTPFFM